MSKGMVSLKSHIRIVRHLVLSGPDVPSEFDRGKQQRRPPRLMSAGLRGPPAGAL